MARRLAWLAVCVLIAVAGSAWIVATEHPAPAADGGATPRFPASWPLSDEGGPVVREDALRRAQVRVSSPVPAVLDPDVLEDEARCRFLPEPPSGTSAKFDCVLDTGEVVKVKYGRNPELAAEVAATRLVAALGFPADRMSVVRRLRCDGCPRFPFLAMSLLHALGLNQRYAAHGRAGGYTNFEWVAVERKFPAPPIETADRQGWAWWELERIDPAAGASRDDVDALRLLAIFLAHWDNKAQNQRLVCLDEPQGIDRRCTRPLAMMQDLGATFGPAKVNLAGWRDLPIWADRRSCAVSMERLPWSGGTFPETRIGEGARRSLARQLASVDDAQVRELFRAARFPEHYSSTDDEKDLAAWTSAFRNRANQIVTAGPCPQ